MNNNKQEKRRNKKKNYSPWFHTNSSYAPFRICRLLLLLLLDHLGSSMPDNSKQQLDVRRLIKLSFRTAQQFRHSSRNLMGSTFRAIIDRWTTQQNVPMVCGCSQLARFNQRETVHIFRLFLNRRRIFLNGFVAFTAVSEQVSHAWLCLCWSV